MNSFWSSLKLLEQSSIIPLEHWQYLQNKPSLPLQLIQKTSEEGAVYLAPETPLACSQTTDISLSINQQIALNLATANNPLMVIQGVPGSGKTRLAQVLIKSLLKQQKRILILTRYPQTKATYQIQNIAFSLSDSQDYDAWLTEQIKREYLGKLPMDFLPLHLLPDALLTQLRSPQKLEKWLHILHEDLSIQEIKSLLSIEFPQVTTARLNLLAYRLQKLAPLLQQQLWLHQLCEQSGATASAICAEIKQQATMPILGTVEEFLQHQELWKTSFDCVIVESAEHLNWSQLVLIAGVADKLILLGNLPLLSFSHRDRFTQSPPLKWLGEFLLPTYRYLLTEQFRLHFTIARAIFDVLYSQWIRTQPKLDIVTLPQARLQMIDVRGKPIDGVNSWEGKRLLKFMSELGVAKAKQIGILAFTEAQKTWLQDNCTSEDRVFIGSFADWVGKEIEILLISCVGYPEKLTAANNAIALTRASDYLILFGDYQLWSSQPSPIQDLLFQPELQRAREISLI